MNKLQNIEVIRRACVAANPEIEQGYWVGGDNALYDPHPSWVNEPIIRLADVLEAARKVGYNSTEDWLAVITGIITRYDLRKDSLTDQSDETLQFLADLLKDTK